MGKLIQSVSLNVDIEKLGLDSIEKVIIENGYIKIIGEAGVVEKITYERRITQDVLLLQHKIT